MEHLQRVGALTGLPQLLRDLGHEPGKVIAAAGLQPADLADAEGSLPFEAVGRLFQVCVSHAGCAHFGLLMGQRSGLSTLGIVGQLMRNAPDVRQAMLDLCRNQQRYVRGSVVYLAVIGETAFWGFGVHYPAMPAVEHFSEAAVAVGANALRELAGIQAEEILLSRAAPSDVDVYRRFYGVTPRFGAEQNALVLPKRLLDTPVTGADADVRSKLEQVVASYWALREPTTAERVSRILRAQVVMERATLESVALELGMHPRTLNRRLKEEDSSFRDLLSEARSEVARQLLRVTTLNVAAIGEALGYADPSGFTRAFERWTGLPPSVWKEGMTVTQEGEPARATRKTAAMA